MRRCRSSLVLGIMLMLAIDLRAEQPLAASTIVVYSSGNVRATNGRDDGSHCFLSVTFSQ